MNDRKYMTKYGIILEMVNILISYSHAHEKKMLSQGRNFSTLLCMFVPVIRYYGGM